MPLFRHSEEKRAQKAAVDAEIARLRSLRPEEVAALLLPALAAEGPFSGHTTREQQLCEYLLRDHPGGGNLKPLELMMRVRRALDKLKDADLVTSFAYARSPVWQITLDGERALAEGTVEQRLTR